jgi:thioredoxin 1
MIASSTRAINVAVRGSAESSVAPRGSNRHTPTRTKEQEMPEHLTEESFAAAIAGTPGPLVVDFWAEWCGPCRVVAPMLERLVGEHPEITIAKVNVDDQPALAAAYSVRGIPTLIRFDGGRETLRVSGALPYERLLRALGVGAGIDTEAA